MMNLNGDKSEILKKSSTNANEIGKWEKHTRGIGKKLLEKFGFTGRLGANETGIEKAIEVEIRPQGVGLGFDTVVKSKSKATESSTTGAGESKKRKSYSEIIVESASWKTGQESKRVKTKRMRTDDFIHGTSSFEQTTVIIDMRGEQKKIISSSDNLSSTDTPLLGEELLHNINSIVDILTNNTLNESKKYKHELTKIETIENELELKHKSIEEDTLKNQKLIELIDILTNKSQQIFDMNDCFQLLL